MSVPFNLSMILLSRNPIIKEKLVKRKPLNKALIVTKLKWNDESLGSTTNVMSNL